MSGDIKLSAPDNYWDIQDEDIVCIPSANFDATILKKIVGVIHYEERQLYNLFLLKHIKTRLIFLSSKPLDSSIVQYLLSLLPNAVSQSELEKRLIFLTANDESPRPLTQKILDQPHIIEQIKHIVRPGKAFLLCFTVTQLERQLSKELSIPIFGSDDLTHEHWGSKSGSREIFAQVDIPHPRGVDLSHSSEELVQKIANLYRLKPVHKMVVKLDQGFSGQGNALLDLSSLNQNTIKQSILQALSNMTFSTPNGTWRWFQERINDMGAIAEEFYEGEDPKCPSVQGCISMNGKVQLLSTHEQIMNGHVYQGCLFPARDIYRSQLHKYAQLVGESLALKGVTGHFGVDFLVQEHSTSLYSLYALEINLRQCGTTHPYFAMKFLTNGDYDCNSGLFYSKGVAKYYKHSDNLHKEEYKGILTTDLLLASMQKNLKFNHESQKGPIFHMLGALCKFGKVGVTCVGDSIEEAEQLYGRVESLLDELGSRVHEKKAAQQCG